MPGRKTVRAAAVRKIKVPKVPRSSYNPDRPISGLLRAQIAMLEEANLSFEPGMTVKGRKPATEGQAARYIQQLHAKLRGYLRKKTEDQSVLPASELRAALAPRSSSRADGSKRWPATAGPSLTIRDIELNPPRPARSARRQKRARTRATR